MRPTHYDGFECRSCEGNGVIRRARRMYEWFRESAEVLCCPTCGGCRRDVGSDPEMYVYGVGFIGGYEEF